MSYAHSHEAVTTYTAFLDSDESSTSTKYPAACELLYQDMPLKFTWNKTKRIWSPMKDKCFCLGRMYYAHPSSGECFFLCLLLTAVKGATSFEHLHTMDDVVYNTFKEACFARGLLEDDREWIQCLEEGRQDLNSVLCSSPFS
jgi:hypothetical protein